LSTEIKEKLEKGNNPSKEGDKRNAYGKIRMDRLGKNLDKNGLQRLKL